ncbi:hypothetical protein LK996_01110 [Lysobacter sp. A6]|uniref:ABC transporter permease n=1 Tax=Noviluteimonas lactosilytica TaxID=2888523 RepID=A0ABS8JDJ5_9GAMM|nr:hypothetical protein [Lysobacter lactosilyticus]MCC8361683.1 hypothetical protein [Lysobacter lactosilyticus]
MSGLPRAIGAILQADLRQRLRSPRFWIVLVALGAAMWWCFPAANADFLTMSVGDGMRGRYSSAWIGMVVALMYSSLLSLAGFYLVRGTVVRDLETRAWQLLVATTMRRSAYLLAKWLSHLAVFVALLAVGLGVGLVAQLVRAEDLRIDVIELAKPVVFLTLPSLALTAALAVWFDLVPWLRRSLGNIAFFVLWLALLGVGVSQAEQAPGAALPWPGDPHGLLVAEYDLSRAWPSIDAGKELGLSVGKQMLEGKAPVLLTWNAWPLTCAMLQARATWLLLGFVLVLSATPLLDRFAANAAVRAVADNGGARLRWLDALLAPLQRSAFGALIAAEVRLVLRPRRWWWWLAMFAAFATQVFAPEKGLVFAMVAAWVLSMDVYSRLAFRERDTNTAALVFTAAGMRGRLLAARTTICVGLAWCVVAPAIVRLLATHPAAGIAAIVAGASVALWGLGFGALFRNARPYEIVLLMAGYVSVQGALVLDVVSAPMTTLAWHAALLPAALALLVGAWWHTVTARA